MRRCVGVAYNKVLFDVEVGSKIQSRYKHI